MDCCGKDNKEYSHDLNKSKMEKDCCETNDKNLKSKKSNVWIFITGLIVILTLAVFLFKPSTVSYAALNNIQEPVKFYKSITCGCCDVHANYLESKGNLDIKILGQSDISNIKEKYGVPLELQSCHTAIIDGYFVEGHMPLEAINKLLSEKPNIKGIALPGMPSGSPGMPGQKLGDFVIYAVHNDGSYSEFMRI